MVAIGTAAAAGIGAAVKGALDFADEMGKASQRFGIPIEALSRLKYAADLSDVSLQTLGTAAQRLSRNMVDAGRGLATPVRAFKELGIEIKNADGTMRSTEEVLHDLADRFASMPDGVQKTAAAMELMGRGGAQMIPLLNGGSSALRDMGAEAQRVGLVISEKTAKEAERFNDALTRLGAVTRGQAQMLAADLAPAMAAVADAAANAGTGASEFGKHLQDVNRDARAVTAAVREFLQVLGLLGRSRLNTLQLAVQGAKADVEALRESVANVPEGMDEAYAAVQGAFGAPAAFSNLRDDLQKAEEEFQRAERALFRYADLESRAATTTTELTGEVSDLGDELDDAAGGGGGGGGARGLSDALSDLRSKAGQVFESTRTPMEQFQAQMAELNQMVQAGLIDWDTYGRAVKEAQDTLKDAGDTGEGVFKGLDQQFGSTVAGIIDGTTSIKEAFASMLAQLGGGLAAAGGKSLFSNLFGNVFSNLKIPGFANGTRFAPGGLAWVGERGPELLNLPRGSQVIPNDEIGAGGSVYNFAPVIDARGADQAAVARLEANQRAMFEEFRSSFSDNVARVSSKPWRRGRV